MITMKKILFLTLTLSLILLTACGQQDNTNTSSISPVHSQAVSYPSSSKIVSSEVSCAPVVSVDKTPFYLNLSADNIVEFGITPGRVSVEPQLQSFSTKDAALIKEIVSELNSIKFVERIKKGPTTGFGWEFWTVDGNGEKTIYRYDGYYKFNEKWYAATEHIDPCEYLMEKLGADWW